MILAVHEGPVDEWPIFEATQFPMLWGDSTRNANWECPCGESIAQGIHNRQLLDILVKCGTCGRLLQTPSRDSGEPLASPRVVEAGGPWPLGSIDLTGGALNSLVGPRAMISEARESGRSIPGLYEPDLRRNLKLDAQTLAWLADELRRLLAENLSTLTQSDERGQRSTTPPTQRHRLIEVIEVCDILAQTYTAIRACGGPTDGQFEAIAEALAIVHFAERWRNHPQWSMLRDGFVYETAHTTTLLAAASYLTDANHGVGIYGRSEKQGMRMSDIWIDVNLEDRVEIEVKVPTILLRPTETISGSSAETLLKRLVKKSRAQRAGTGSSLLVIGGHRLGNTRLALVESARRLFENNLPRWSNLAGIIIIDNSVDFAVDDGPTYRLLPGIKVEIATHPGYSGQISIGPATPEVLDYSAKA